MGTASRALMNMAPISASAADAMTARMICAMFKTAPLFGGSGMLFDIKKMAAGSASCLFFAEVGGVAVDGEDHVAGMVR